MLDKHGRNIDYLRISLTNNCNLRCIYCMPEKGQIPQVNTLSLNEIINFLKVSKELGIKKVRYTGGEPLLFKEIERLIYETNKTIGIDDIAITTNAITLEPMVKDLMKAGLSRINISLDTLKPDKYKLITRGGELKKVQDSIDRCLTLGMPHIKLNIVIIKGVNDDEIEDLVLLTKDMPISVRFIEVMPIGQGIEYYKNGYISSEEILNYTHDLLPIDNKDHSTAKLYRLPESAGTVGFISPMSNKFCSSCNKMRLTSCGTLKPCLHSNQEIDVKKYFDNEEELKQVLINGILSKPLQHKIEEEKVSGSKKMMFEIGG